MPDPKVKMSVRQWMSRTPNWIYVTVLVALLTVFTWSFYYWSPFTYGTGFEDVETIRSRKWISSWDFQFIPNI